MMCFSVALFALFAGCGDDGVDEIVGDYGKIILNGQNIAGVWALVGDKVESEYIDYEVKELCIIDRETISHYMRAYYLGGFGFKEGVLFECSLDDYSNLKASATFDVLDNKGYIAGVYVCDLELSDGFLTIKYKGNSYTFLKVRGFGKFGEFPSSGKVDELGLPIPLDNEIYYRTNDRELIHLSTPWKYSNTYNKEKNYGRIVSLMGSFVSTPTWAPDNGALGSELLDTNMTNISLPTSITTIALSGCTSLESITIPNNVTLIGDRAFYNCKSLASVTIPDSVTSIGVSAFYGCTSLESITIPNDVTLIGDWAFYNCKSLASVTIPNSVTSIGWAAFAYCGLKSVFIPDSVTSISTCAFVGCPNLSKFIGKFASEDGRCLVVNNMLNSFAPAGLTEYTIPNNITLIGDGAFEGSSSLMSITIPDGVTLIGLGAFYDCRDLTNVFCKCTTPPSLGDSAFYNTCWNLKIYVPSKYLDDYKHMWTSVVDKIEPYDYN